MSTYYKYIGMGTINSERYRRTKDIFENSRLYMGQYSEMNDPMEGFYKGNRLTKTEIENIRRGKPNIRMCCLSQSFSDVLMWAHYAEDHKGLCVEVEIVDTNSKELPVIYNRTLYRPTVYTGDLVDNILSRKLIPWKNEQEVRYLRSSSTGASTEKHLKVRITKVYIGCLLQQSQFNNYKKRIEKWLKENHHPVVPIIQMERKNLTYWNGRRNSHLL